MPNIASVLKAEIARIARKEIKAHVDVTKRATAQHRSEIAALKRRVVQLEQALRQATRRASKSPAAESTKADTALRFSAKGLASQRRRLGLSAEDFGRLVGSSGLSIYKWEAGKATPRARFMPAIAAVRKMGKKEAAKLLAAS